MVALTSSSIERGAGLYKIAHLLARGVGLTVGRLSYEDSRSQPAENPERPPPKPGFAKNLQPSHICSEIKDMGAFGEIFSAHLFIAICGCTFM